MTTRITYDHRAGSHADHNPSHIRFARRRSDGLPILPVEPPLRGWGHDLLNAVAAVASFAFILTVLWTVL